MASAEQQENSSDHTSVVTQSKTVIVMRKNQKVAQVSLYCKLNMLVPQLQRLSGRLQGESADKSRSSSQGN